MIPENQAKNSADIRKSQTEGGPIIASAAHNTRLSARSARNGLAHWALFVVCVALFVAIALITARAQQTPPSGLVRAPTVDDVAPGVTDETRDLTDIPSRMRHMPVWPLKVVSWHLDSAAKAGAVEFRPTPRRIWRHTFGAERQSASHANFDVSSLNADVVLLQGVRLIAHARLLFPARDWRVVVSRQFLRPILAPPDASTGWGDQARTATTAIAVRYQRGVRIAGQEQITGTVLPTSDASGAPETAAAIALRLRVEDEVVWIVSADLARPCFGPAEQTVRTERDAVEAPCRALSEWYSSRRAGARVVIGGPNAASALFEPAAQVPPSCPAQMVGVLATGVHRDTANGHSALHRLVLRARSLPSAGCLARLDLPATGRTP
jgi:hypothetical protein